MSPLRLCLIDDDPAELALTQELLRQAIPDVDIHIECDARLALQACENQAFDCLIIDYNMPFLDGLTCAQELRGAFPYLPIVLSTSFGDEVLAANALTSGVTDYIPKSRMTLESLRRAVEHAVRVTKQARIIDEQREELENFAYALAHDFKQPIRQIRTFATLITEAIEGRRSSDTLNHLAFMNGAAKRLADLVDVMSQYTLLGKAPTFEAISVNRVLDGVRASLAPYLEERCGRIVVSPAPSILGNDAMMTQVAQNIIVNGLKYNKSESPTVIVTNYVEGDRCVMKFEDNGIGIESRYIEDIFKPLTRLHNSSEYTGSGLGLTLARKAVLAQNGEIWCESEPGKGSAFLVSLPLPPAQHANSEETEERGVAPLTT
ncbi:ATP-binding protein [uncultured Brevundimonas sp.]|uniref:sensor histidine kinase n=1 Tax=uncultured Brevundimonas sp. TaxID=213418 RepID=UPI0026051E5E|nr:hybrid sensor histidine kinase/response regulator [uncultured Brevundimonas sp.]